MTHRRPAPASMSGRWARTVAATFGVLLGAVDFAASSDPRVGSHGDKALDPKGKAGASEHGLTIALPPGWHQLRLGAGYRGVGAYCDAGIVEVLVEWLPFDEGTRTADLDRQVGANSKKEILSRFAQLRGRGFRKVGLTADGNRMSFVVFFPDPPAERVAVLVICGEANERQMAELEKVVSSLRKVPCQYDCRSAVAIGEFTTAAPGSAKGARNLAQEYGLQNVFDPSVPYARDPSMPEIDLNAISELVEKIKRVCCK